MHELYNLKDINVFYNGTRDCPQIEKLKKYCTFNDLSRPIDIIPLSQSIIVNRRLQIFVNDEKERNSDITLFNINRHASPYITKYLNHIAYLERLSPVPDKNFIYDFLVYLCDHQGVDKSILDINKYSYLNNFEWASKRIQQNIHYNNSEILNLIDMITSHDANSFVLGLNALKKSKRHCINVFIACLICKMIAVPVKNSLSYFYSSEAGVIMRQAIIEFLDSVINRDSIFNTFFSSYISYVRSEGRHPYQSKIIRDNQYASEALIRSYSHLLNSVILANKDTHIQYSVFREEDYEFLTNEKVYKLVFNKLNAIIDYRNIKFKPLQPFKEQVSDGPSANYEEFNL